MRLSGSFPVSKHQLLLGKLLGALLPILAAFGFPLLLGIAGVVWMPGTQFTGPELIRLALIVLAFALYLTAFICIGLLGSCLTHRSSTAFVLLLGIWVASVVVLPRLSLITADALRPSASVYELEAAKTAAIKSNSDRMYAIMNRWDQEHIQSGQEWWRTPEGQEMRRLYYSKVRREDNWKPAEAQQARLEEAFRNRYNARLGLAMTLARLSPTFAFDNATIRLASAGMERHQRFLAAYHIHRERYTDWFFNATDRDALKSSNPAKYGQYKWDTSGMPRLAYQEAWVAEDVQMALVDLGILGLWGIVFFAWAYVAMLRYDLR